MLKKWLVLFTTIVFVAACQSQLYNQTEANVAKVKLKANAAIRHSDNSGKGSPPLVINKGLYIDRTPVSIVRHGPSWLNNRIVIRGDRLPFSYYSRTVARGAGANILTKYQVGIDSSVPVSINYSGTVKGALDLLAVRSGLVYSIRQNKIYWQAFITRTFDIAFMPGATDYLVGSEAGGGAGTANTASQGTGGTVSNYVSSDASESMYSNLKGTLSVWKDLDATIRQLLSPEGRVIVSESTTSITVRDRPMNVELIGQYIANLNKSLSKQVLVKVQVLEVQLQNDYSFGIDWQLVAKAFHNSPFVVNGSYGTPVSIIQSFTPQTGILGNTVGPAYPQIGTMVRPDKASQVPSYTVLLNALNQQGKTSIVTQPRVVCLNNQVSVVRIVQHQGYVASVQNTSFAPGTGGQSPDNTVTSQVTPGTVITGLTLYILPKITRNKIYMQVNADLSTLQSLDPAGSGTTQIQLPNIIEKHFNQRSVIRSGETLILSGFRQVANRTGANQFITSQALGGKGAQQTSTETIVLLTPIILNGRG